MEESKFTTPNGKVVEAFTTNTTVGWGIRFTSGGQLPSDLTGSYMCKRDAESAIALYLDSLSKEPKNAKTQRNKTVSDS